MKNLIVLLFAITGVWISACNNNSTNSAAKNDNMMMNHDSVPMQPGGTADKEVKMMTATFSNLDPGVSGYMHGLLQDYLSVKNALVEGKSGDAGNSAGKMYDLMKGFDKSLLTTDQKKIYDDIEDDLKENAEHISKSEIDHQREHFSMMSEDMYDLVKAFGAGMTLYHDHCPMYKNGSMWLSETKDIHNPYYGSKMMTCGSVKEMFQ